MKFNENPLKLLDDVSWRGDHLYSVTLKDALVHVNELIDSPSSDDHQQAYNQLVRMQEMPMAEQQRLRMWHAKGRAAMAISKLAEADDALLNALDIALPYASFHELDTPMATEAAIACVELAQLHQRVQHWLGRYNDATESLKIVLDLLKQIPAEARTAPLQSLELRALKSLADYTFMLGLYDQSLAYLEQAELFLMTSADPIYEKACILWTRALLYRWRGEADRALWLAQESAEIFARIEPNPNIKRDESARARVDLAVVECACDAANYFATGKAFKAYRAVARAYLQEALSLTAAADNLAARGLAALAQIRFERLTTPIGIQRHHLSRVERIKGEIHAAERTNDLAWMLAAYTEMGREFEAIGDNPAAKKWYEIVTDRLRGSEMTSMGVWASRGLRRLSSQGAAL